MDCLPTLETRSRTRGFGRAGSAEAVREQPLHSTKGQNPVEGQCLLMVQSPLSEQVLHRAVTDRPVHLPKGHSKSKALKETWPVSQENQWLISRLFGSGGYRRSQPFLGVQLLPPALASSSVCLSSLRSSPDIEFIVHAKSRMISSPDLNDICKDPLSK